MKRGHVVLFAVLVVCCQNLYAAPVDIVGGQTSVVLDTDTLSTAASLNLSGFSSEVIVPGALPGSVAFRINSRNDPVSPTTFSYDTTDFAGTFSGTLEHTGLVIFNEGTVPVGDFSIDYDPGREGTLGENASGFFVESTAGIGVILFDVANPTTLIPGATELIIEADLLVSPEFSDFLQTSGLATAPLAGADVGDVRVDAVIPAPGAIFLSGIGATLVHWLRRRRAL